MMRRTEVNLYTDDKEYAEALAEAAVQFGRKCNINILDVGDFLEVMLNEEKCDKEDEELLDDILGDDYREMVSKYAGAGEIFSAVRSAHLQSLFGAKVEDTCFESKRKPEDVYWYDRSSEGIDKSGCEIISVMAPKGGMGTSTFALNLSRELSRYRDKKVAILSFDVFEPNFRNRDMAVDFLENYGGGIDSEQFLYRHLYANGMDADSNDGLYSILMKEALREDEYGVLSFEPSAYLNPINGINELDLLLVVHDIISIMGLDYIVLDFGVNVSLASAFSLIESMKIVKMGNGKNVRFENTIRALLDFDDEIFSFPCTEKYDSLTLTGTYGLRVKEICDRLLGWEFDDESLHFRAEEECYG
ncbi:MAG: hypothetical protein LBN34_02350 [Clostridiales Family XIII bacterium]|nr:hypothetical protein [Clostridiales Family XIII bacterium]